eukprot:CAMPEP_0118868234 /NCGR_PEP_ID=MMETSP1163-20130328/11700_1 /TAXON_ID=124430 /ORGANISM="Phaeomonas parva, Strain CCMP2877" /LENGTH=60 /DNA_ID=CAMNT_0006802855 /DNA_START=96 /DNA_END=275 /DNA_ORIENTATION=+
MAESKPTLATTRRGRQSQGPPTANSRMPSLRLARILTPDSKSSKPKFTASGPPRASCSFR